MKKISYFALTATLLVFLSGCTEKVETSPVTVDLLQKATVNGVALAELDLQKAGLEFVPEGTKILVEVPYSQLNPSVTSNQMWQEWVEVGDRGKFTVKIPATSSGVNVMVNSVFEGEQVQPYGYYTRTILKKYNINNAVAFIKTGQSADVALNYYASQPITYVPKVTITGQVNAELDAQKIGLENVPNGTFLVFSSDTWADSVAVKNGTYTIQIPKDMTIKRKIVFLADQKVWIPNAQPALSEYLTIPDRLFTSYVSNLSYSSNSQIPSFEVTATVIAGNPTSINLSGAALAELDATSPGFENIPNGTKIYFYTNNWGGTAIVNDGKYTVDIPYGRSVNYFLEFSANKKNLINGAISLVLYKYTYSGTFASTIPPFVLNINAGAGMPE